MLRRIAAFIFILTVAGNIWAGVCECIGGDDHARSSCCKRELSERSSFQAKPCCDDECGPEPYVSPDRTQSDSAVKIPLPADNIAPERGPIDGRSVSLGSRVPPVPFVDLRLQFPRPPNLYIKHSSFII